MATADEWEEASLSVRSDHTLVRGNPGNLREQCTLGSKADRLGCQGGSLVAGRPKLGGLALSVSSDMAKLGMAQQIE